MHVCVCAVCPCVYIYTHAYIYIYIHTHARARTRTQTYILTTEQKKGREGEKKKKKSQVHLKLLAESCSHWLGGSWRSGDTHGACSPRCRRCCCRRSRRRCWSCPCRFPCCSGTNVTSNVPIIYLLLPAPFLLQDVTTALTLRTCRSLRRLEKEKRGYQGRRFLCLGGNFPL